MANEFEKINEEELEQATGGSGGITGIAEGSTHKKVKGLKTGYLALRNAAGYDYSNEIGQLQNGDEVDITGPTVTVKNDFQGKTTKYTWVTVRKSKTCAKGKSGYVNASFLHSV